MKALSKNVTRRREQLEYEERRRKREEFLASLSDEEREAYLAEEDRKQKEALKKFSTLITMAKSFGGPYSL